MSRLVAIILIARFGGVFELGEIIYYWRFSGPEELIQTLESWPQDKPLPIIVYRKYTSDPLPRFKEPLAPAVHPGNGFDTVKVTIRSPFTNQLIGYDQPYHLETPKDQHIEDFKEAERLSDRLTRWLRGGRGWTAGPKPNIMAHDILIGFEPKWKRKPLTPELVRKF
jgi:hypothetical protein